MSNPHPEALAIDGGSAVRSDTLPYGRQSISEGDIDAVLAAMRSDWLTTGPRVAEFESAFAKFVGVAHAVAVSSGTAALHAAMFALDIGPGDEVILPAMTFVATANCILYQGGTPVVVDVDPETLLIDPESVEAHITRRTRAVIAVDYAGQPCDYEILRELARRHDIQIIADACHATGGSYHGRPVGSLADISTFSFHPVKHLTTGEGGMATTSDRHLAERMRIFRNHGIVTDHHQRESEGTWVYDMTHLGYNYRLTDIQCALGIEQLKRLPDWLGRRREIAFKYNEAFREVAALEPITVRDDVEHAYHLYVVRLNLDILNCDREQVFRALRAEGIGVNVHYRPVHLHSFHRKCLGERVVRCSVAEAAYESILSLPMFAEMTNNDVESVIRAVTKIVAAYAKI